MSWYPSSGLCVHREGLHGFFLTLGSEFTSGIQPCWFSQFTLNIGRPLFLFLSAGEQRDRIAHNNFLK
jgi:hypothetical protein